ncbi:hypothetical protein FA13DRAFT_1787108 [Coprinellus micaceus]|uniref:Uncharacterized protein n=1 Tax=Coprinellus micaceus TaxID=71717 RepID=A0A4Y7TS38_COPMI|nr:hypothetical protein FA13DRAFT_1787108 [Coprinellus micaceus]
MDSPFSSFLDSNYVPSDDEAATIKEMVASRDAALKDLDERIRALTDERMKHAKFIKDHNALVSPMRKLPTDILSSIFRSYLEQCHWRSSYRSRQHPSVLLTHICRRWREIALGTPLLWTTIRVKCPSSPYHFYKSCPESLRNRLAQVWDTLTQKEEHMFAMCAERSANCPLRLTVVASDVFPITSQGTGSTPYYLKIDEEGRRRLLDAICDTSPRWERITLDIRIENLASPILNLLRVTAERAPQLQSIQFAGAVSPLEQDVASACQGFTLFAAQGLHTLRWGQLMSMAMASSIPVRWENVTEIYFGDSAGGQIGHRQQMSFADAIEMLEKCPHLARCTMSLRNSAEDGDNAWFAAAPPAFTQPFTFERKIVLPQLHTLGIRAPAIPTGFASALVLPSLHTLSLHSKRYRRGLLNDRGTVEFARVFGSQLKNAAFNFASLTQFGLFECLRSLPVVTRLRLTEGYDYLDAGIQSPPGGTKAMLNASILAQLRPKYNEKGYLVGQCYCPKLERLFCNLAGQDTVEGSLVEFVRSRREIPVESQHEIARIKEVAMNLDLSETVDIGRELRETGIDMVDCILKIRYRGLDEDTERQIGYKTYSPRDLYEDVCRDEFEGDLLGIL